MRLALPTPDTDFTRDALRRYICNTFDEMLVTIDPNARAAAGLPARGDVRPFDFIVIGGGTFGSTLAEDLWFRATGRAERILVLDGGPFLLPEHVQNLPVLGINAGAARRITCRKMRSGASPGTPMTLSAFPAWLLHGRAVCCSGAGGRRGCSIGDAEASGLRRYSTSIQTDEQQGLLPPVERSDRCYRNE